MTLEKQMVCGSRLLCSIILKSDTQGENDTQREKLCLIQFSTRNGWLATSDLFDMFTQSIRFYYTLYYYVLRVQ